MLLPEVSTLSKKMFQLVAEKDLKYYLYTTTTNTNDMKKKKNVYHWVKHFKLILCVYKTRITI